MLSVSTLFVLFLLFVVVLSGEPKQIQRRGFVERKLFQAPPPPPPRSNFIAGRPKAALLFWFFDGFRCGVRLCFVIVLDMKIEKRLGGDHLYGKWLFTLYGKWLFTWLSLVMSLLMSYIVPSFFP